MMGKTEPTHESPKAVLARMWDELLELRTDLVHKVDRVDAMLISTKGALEEMHVKVAEPPVSTTKRPQWLAQIVPGELPRVPRKWLIWLMVRDYGPIAVPVIDQKMRDFGLLPKRREPFYQSIMSLLTKNLEFEGFVTRRKEGRTVWWTATEKQPEPHLLKGFDIRV